MVVSHVVILVRAVMVVGRAAVRAVGLAVRAGAVTIGVALAVVIGVERQQDQQEKP